MLQVQADWVLRTALLYSRVGINRTFFYQLYDDNATVPIQFYSMGLLNNDKTRKPAADYLAQTLKLFGDYSYKKTLGRAVGDVFSHRTARRPLRTQRPLGLHAGDARRTGPHR